MDDQLWAPAASGFGPAVVAAGLVVLAVILWLPPQRLRQRRAPGGSRLDRWHRHLMRLLPPPHPGAPTLQRRGLVGVAIASVVAIQLISRPGAWPLVGLVGAPALAVAVAVFLGRLEPLAARRRRVAMVLAAPQLLDLLAAALEAGQPLRSATKAVAEVVSGPLSQDLQRVVVAIGLGQPEDLAWRELRDHPVLGAVAVDLARSVSSGTRLVDLLRQHGRMARRLRHGQLEALAKAVGVRCLVPISVCFLPAFVLVGVVPIVGSVVASFVG